MTTCMKPENAVPIAPLNNDHPLEIEEEDVSEDADNGRKKLKGLNDDIKTKSEEIKKELDILNGNIFKCKDPKIESQVLIKDKLGLIKEDVRKLASSIDIGVTKKLRSLITYLPPITDDRKWVDLRIENEIFKSEEMSRLFASFHRLESPQVKMCLLCLSIFPENSVIKKKPIIYWWMGEGLVSGNGNTTAEEVGEQVMQALLSEGIIMASSDNKFVSSTVNNFVVCPWIRRMLIQLAKKSSFLAFSSEWKPCNGNRRAFLWGQQKGNDELKEEMLTVFNVNEQYLGTRSQWNTRQKRVEVLQLGRWQGSTTHHIEVEDGRVLKDGLGSQKYLKYLSLRGISRIETLPASISKLISLQILDLRACHNLEKVPRGISRLKNLTHLDVSECYLLESMPKGLEQLPALQVVKGFVIGTADKNSCKISDLETLNNLRKLSIRVNNKDEAKQLQSLKKLHALRILAISWGVISSVPEAISSDAPSKATVSPAALEALYVAPPPKAGVSHVAPEAVPAAPPPKAAVSPVVPKTPVSPAAPPKTAVSQVALPKMTVSPVALEAISAAPPPKAIVSHVAPPKATNSPVAPEVAISSAAPETVSPNAPEDEVSRAEREAMKYTSLPSSLTKLDLRLVPFAAVPKWLLPDRLPNLDKLYINGGQLNTLDYNNTQVVWKSVKFVRLKHLEKLNINTEKMKSVFPNTGDTRLQEAPPVSI